MMIEVIPLNFIQINNGLISYDNKQRMYYRYVAARNESLHILFVWEYTYTYIHTYVADALYLPKLDCYGGERGHN